jgi:hypothetical protein
VAGSGESRSAIHYDCLVLCVCTTFQLAQQAGRSLPMGTVRAFLTNLLDLLQSSFFLLLHQLQLRL